MANRSSDNKRSSRKRKESGRGPGAAQRTGRGGLLRRTRQGAHEENSVLIYGIHSVDAALRNPAREILDVWVTKNARRRLEEALRLSNVSPTPVTPLDLDDLAGPDAVHQGAVLRARPLTEPSIDELPDRGLCLALDQVTDPHNVGAIMRSAAAFGVCAVIMTARNSPALSGVLAKTASGGLEHVPVILVTNLSRALSTLGDRGYVRIGLDGGGALALDASVRAAASVLVLGAEGKGLRRLTKEHCDLLCRIPTNGALSSLNVSNAAAVALFALQSGDREDQSS